MTAASLTGSLVTPLFAASSGSEVNLSIALIFLAGVGALWAGARLRIPSILLLLPAGVLVGPILGWLDPDAVFGDVLFPLISLGVGLLLFEGGLSLRFKRTTEVRDVVLRLVTVGALVTWIVGWIAASIFLDVSTGIACLIGAVLVVSGPTVVIPLLRLAQPRHSVAEVLRWEGIVIDPVGATLAVVVLDAVIEDADPARALVRTAITLLAGGAIGAAFGFVYLVALARHLLPDHLHNPVAVAFAIAAFAGANAFQTEAGLMATTALGLVLANQHRVPVRHVYEFAEDVSYLVLGGLFLVLGARIDLDELADAALPALALTAVMVVIARPLTVIVSTWRSGMSSNERNFLMCIAPRGIVAAAVSSVFAVELTEAGIDPGPLAPTIMVVIVATVVLYGFTAVPMARFLRIARPPNRAVAIIGGSRWHLDLASALQELGVSTMIFTDRAAERRRARNRTLLAYEGDLQSEELEEAADALGVGVVLVLSDRTELVTAAVSRLGHFVGRSNVYALQHSPGSGGVGATITTRPAFGSLTAEEMDDIIRVGGEIFVDHESTFSDAQGAPNGTATHIDSPNDLSPEGGPLDPFVLASVEPETQVVTFGPGSGVAIMVRPGETLP